MSDLNRYLASIYRDGGRGPVEYDCWGLARAVRNEIYGCSLLREWGYVDPNSKRQVTGAWKKALPLLERSQPSLGALACVFRGRLLLHLGVIVDADRGLSVLETLPATGPRILPISRFERIYQCVEYWNDLNISKQA